jgi:hypothetical protein
MVECIAKQKKIKYSTCPPPIYGRHEAIEAEEGMYHPSRPGASEVK